MEGISMLGYGGALGGCGIAAVVEVIINLH